MTLVFDRWDKRFFHGIELFNQKHFFEAHEEWEKLWMDTPKDDALRDFYKGLIQTAAVYEHIRRHNLRGAAGLLATSPNLLEPFAPRTLGLDVRALLADLGQSRRQVLDTNNFEPTRPPQLKLWIDSQ